MKRILTLLLGAFLAFGVLVPQSSTVGAAETEDLYAAINAYRQTLGLPAIPLSPQLTCGRAGPRPGPDREFHH